MNQIFRSSGVIPAIAIVWMSAACGSSSEQAPGSGLTTAGTSRTPSESTGGTAGLGSGGTPDSGQPSGSGGLGPNDGTGGHAGSIAGHPNGGSAAAGAGGIGGESGAAAGGAGESGHPNGGSSAGGAGGIGGTSPGGAGGVGGSGHSCGIQTGESSCDGCIIGHCETACITCTDSVDCMNLKVCMFDCDPANTTCQQNCYTKYPKGEDNLLALFGPDGCVSKFCGAECYGDPGTGGAGGSGGTGGHGGSAGGTVGGSTVEECQGKTALTLSVDNPNVEVHSGFAIYAQGQSEVYAYTRASVTDYAYGGHAGETKVRLLLPHLTGPGQYQGLMGVFQWSTANGRWENVVTPSDVVVVDIASVEIVMPNDLMCNGRVIGKAEGLFDSMYAGVLYFDVPLLTPSFPHTQPGPP